MAENHMLNKKANLQAVRQRLLDSILVLFAVCMIIYFSFASQYFLSVRNFMNIFSSIFTLISMLNNNKAVTAVICILTAFLFLIIGAQLHKMLSEPETNMALVMTDNGQEYQELPNPKFLDGGGRKTVQFFYDFLPGGQVVQCTSLETENLSLLPVYSLVIVVLTTSAGMFFFKKKELK